MTAPDLTPAELDDLDETIAYALRFNERGKPLGVRMRDDPAVIARRVTDHLERCGFIVMRRPAIKRHSTV